MKIYYAATTIGWLFFHGYDSATGWIILIVLYLLPLILRAGGGEGFGDAFGSIDFDGGDSSCGDGGGCDGGGD